ncbi:MAG: cytochrome c4 [Gammaproteobacteria bacterium]|nr:cytochrome c4 [Gammaproteobacteria bacterium]
MDKWLVSVSIALALASAGIQAAGDAAQGKTKSATCLACHGPDGNSPNPIWPKLAGQHPGYIVQQLRDFKAGDRKNDLMTPMVAPLNDQDIEDLAAYFGSQVQAKGVAAADQVALGEKIFRAGNPASGVAACMACHGPTGSGNAPAKFPRIGGQHAAYLEQSLKAFRSGGRTNDANQMMQGVAAKMTDAEISAVAQYAQGLR